MNGKSGNGRVDGLSPVARQSNICPAQNQEEIVVACVGLAGRGKETPYALGFRHDTNCADRRQPGRDARNWRRRRSAARGFIDSWEDSRENCSLKAGDIKQVVLEQFGQHRRVPRKPAMAGRYAARSPTVPADPATQQVTD